MSISLHDGDLSATLRTDEGEHVVLYFERPAPQDVLALVNHQVTARGTRYRSAGDGKDLLVVEDLQKRPAPKHKPATEWNPRKYEGIFKGLLDFDNAVAVVQEQRENI